MRPPRFKFPDEVRTITRGIASRMIREDEVAASPEELDAWIAARPEVREPLESHGYGREFTADDLFPLYEAYVAAAAGAPPTTDEKRGPPWEYWLWGLLLVILVAIAWVIAA